MTDTPLVTVVIPLYNGAAFVAKSLDSVTDQTLVDLDGGGRRRWFVRRRA